MQKWISAVLIITVFFLSSLNAQSVEKEIEELENQFGRFEYDKVLNQGRFLLNITYLSKQDSMAIYQIMLQAAFAKSDTIQSEQIVKDMVACSPSFNLDPITVSPKIIRFYREIRQKLDTPKSKEPEVEPVHIMHGPDIKHSLSNLIFPGSGFLWAQKKPKGYLYSGISTAVLSGLVYYSFKTADYRDDYLSAGRESDFNKLYNRYNNAYRTRNVLFIGYVLYSLYSFYDFYNESIDDQMRISFDITKSSGIYLSLRTSL